MIKLLEILALLVSVGVVALVIHFLPWQVSAGIGAAMIVCSLWRHGVRRSD